MSRSSPDPDDVLRDVVAKLVSSGYAWAGIFFLEDGELALGPQAGTPDESARSRVPVLWKGERIAELAADGVERSRSTRWRRQSASTASSAGTPAASPGSREVQNRASPRHGG